MFSLINFPQLYPPCHSNSTFLEIGCNNTDFDPFYKKKQKK